MKIVKYYNLENSNGLIVIFWTSIADSKIIGPFKI